MRFPILALLCCTSLSAVAQSGQPDTWSASPKFAIEGTGEKETIIFIAGMSYGLSYLNKAYENAGVKVGICLPEGKAYIGSREIVDILNELGKPTYTSEEATSAVVQELAKRNPCK